MKLEQIDKTRYRNHLNKVIVACIASLLAGSLGIARVLIVLFPSESGSHFHWNLLGVIVTCLIIFMVLKRVQYHPFMYEVRYVWLLKQSLNKITRKAAKLQTAANQGDVNAMTALQYSYAGSRQLWQLDDNTLTMDELAMKQKELDVLAQKYQLVLDENAYHDTILANY